MRIAILQMAAGPARALDRIVEAAGRAAAAGARLLVAPELAVGGYGAGERMAGLAEPPDGPAARRLAATARSAGIAIIAGFAEQAAEGVYDSALAVTADGRSAVHRKCQLFGDYEHRLFLPAPPATTLIEIGGLAVGILICFEAEFPEHVRRLARAGAALVAVPTALPAGPHAAFIAGRVMPVRAFENQVFLAYANLAGADEAFAYAGLSCIAAPDGADLGRAGATQEALLVADIEPAAYAASRQENPYLSALGAGRLTTGPPRQVPDRSPIGPLQLSAPSAAQAAPRPLPTRGARGRSPGAPGR